MVELKGRQVSLGSIPPVIWMTLFLIVVYSIFAPGFLSGRNALNIAIQAAPLFVVSIGMTMIILTEGIDLSLGFVAGLAGVVTSLMLQAGHPVALAILGGLASGTLRGLVNGFLVSIASLPTFIATLGVGSVAYGIGLIATGGRSIPALQESFRFIFQGSVLGIRMPIVIALVVFGVTYVFMHFTAYGRNVVGLGGNPQALRTAGVNIELARLLVYVYGGLLAAVGGLMVAARTASGYAAAQEGWHFEAIAATVVGGTSFREGRGRIANTILGVLLISVLRNGLNIAGVHNMYQYGLIGVTVVTAIVLDVLFTKARDR